MVEGGAVDLLRMEYVPLSQVLLWQRNPKLHDIGGMIQAFKEHGFKDPMKFEPELNGGQGGIGHGNGRATALQAMKEAGEPPPRGVYVRGDGEWAVPVTFGVDAQSEAAAEAYAIDHNNLTLTGGDLTAWDMARMYDASYVPLLKELAARSAPIITMDGDDVDGLAALMEKTAPTAPDDFQSYDEDIDVDYRCPKCGYEWSGEPT